VQAGIGFVGAINVNGQFTDIVEIDNLNAMGNQAIVSGLRTGHGTFDLVLYGGQIINEIVGGGAGAYTDQGVFLHVAQRGFGDSLLEFILGHGWALCVDNKTRRVYWKMTALFIS